MADYIGQRFGNYLLISKLGSGGFADVYLGEHYELKSKAAIKVLNKALVGNEVDKFRNEARTLVNLRHPNIIRVFDFEVPQPPQQLPPFLIMEYASQGTLEQLQGKISPLAQIMPYIKQIAAALQYVHGKGLMHLDIKPANILLGDDGEALLSDFGIALAIQGVAVPANKELVGTVEYMSPEHLRRNPCAASDQYSLAVVVYELLTGVCPFDGTTVEVRKQHLNDQPLSVRSRVTSISPEVEQVIDRALEKDPIKRFPTITAFAEALEQAFLPQAQSGGSSQQAPSGTGASSAPPTTPVGPAAINVSGQAVGTSGKTQRVGKPLGSIGSTFISDATIYELRGHRREILSLCWSPDSKYVASASADRSIRIWDITLGDAILTYQGHKKSVHVVAWSPDGAYLASMSGDQVVRVWDATTGSTLLAYEAHATQGIGFTFALAWSPDSHYLASGSDNNEVHVWEAKSGQVAATYADHTSWISSIAWSPDGQRIASGSNDRTIRIWEALTGKHLLTYQHLAGEVCALAWSPDGKLLAAAYRGMIKLWHAQKQDDVLATYEQKGVRILSWSSNNQYLASAGDDKVAEIRDIQAGQVIFTYREHKVPIQALAWSPDGKFLVTGDEDGVICLWKLKQYP